ncbi:MAG: HD domain-containing protein [Candidatus Omnitrophica bacterium]|nr:HD domain-containing protein [Candidatus Omnitrophota bacterium]MBU4479266.1 HD domain-containing protein [Candidatus Omnitrophota bacterium]MCG2703058.1 HD domain-containing protein [Candidatus Omnitrophota bacterium]
MISFRKLKRFKDDPVLRRIDMISQRHGVKSYLVGGALRELLLKRNAGKRIDWDFAVEKDALKVSRDLAKDLRAAYVVLDEAAGTARVLYRTDKCAYELDFSDFRADTLREDLRRRDFTVNTLCLDVRSLLNSHRGDTPVFDYFDADGDIRRKCVRLTRKKNLSDDPLRILRGFTLCARYGLDFDKETLLLIKKQASLLRNISAERVSEELAKILTVPCAYAYAAAMDKAGVLEFLFPEIAPMRGLDQGGFHHLDVWSHSLETLAQLEKLLRQLPKKIPLRVAAEVTVYLNEEVACGRTRLWVLKLACFFHDIGKPETRFVGEGAKVHFYTHEKKGAAIAAGIARRLKLSKREITVLKNAVRDHLRAGYIVNRRPSKKAKFRFFRDLREDAVLVLLLALADRRAMRGTLSRKKSFVFLEEEIFNLVVLFFKNKKEEPRKVRLLDGHELMSFLNLSPGPAIGVILRKLEEAQAVNRVRNKQEAKELALKTLQNFVKNG